MVPENILFVDETDILKQDIANLESDRIVLLEQIKQLQLHLDNMQKQYEAKSATYNILFDAYCDIIKYVRNSEDFSISTQEMKSLKEGINEMIKKSICLRKHCWVRK